MNKQGGLMNTELIAELQGIYPLNDYEFQNAMSSNYRGFQDMCGEAADAIEAADRRIAELEAAQRWIPAEDPPKYTGDYNVVCNIGSMLGGYTDVRTYRFERFKGQEPKWCIPNRFDEIVSVTHWQPLPQPPQKG